MSEDRNLDLGDMFEDDDIDTSIFDDDKLGSPASGDSLGTKMEDGTVVDSSTGEVLHEPEDSEDHSSAGEPETQFNDASEPRENKDDHEGDSGCSRSTRPAEEERVFTPPAPIVPDEPDSERILDKLLKTVRHKDVEELCEFSRSYADMNYEDGFSYLVGRVHEIVKRYQEHGFGANLSTAGDDLIELSGLLVTLAEPLGFLEGAFEEAEEIRKLALSAFYLEAKKYRVDGWKLTDRDAENIARRLSQPYIKQAGKTAIYARMLRNLWYGLRSFVDMLNASIMRAGSELKYIEQSEGAAFRRNRKDPTDFTPEEYKKGFKEDCKEIQKEIDKPKPKPESEPVDDNGWDDDDYEIDL